MKKNMAFIFIGVVCGVKGNALFASQSPENNAIVSAVSVPREASLDEFDQLVDEATANKVFRGIPAAAAEPHGLKLFFMKCGVSLLTFYTSMIVKYRVCKTWFKAHCVDPIAHKIGVTCGCCYAAKQTDKA
jgi:hypothetical protein